VDHELHPQLGDLVLDDEQHLVVARRIAERLLRGQQRRQLQSRRRSCGRADRARCLFERTQVVGVGHVDDFVPNLTVYPRRRVLRAALQTRQRLSYCLASLSAPPRASRAPRRPHQAASHRRPACPPPPHSKSNTCNTSTPTASSSATTCPLARDVRELVALYKEMLFVRVFDSKAVALQRTGKLGVRLVPRPRSRAHRDRRIGDAGRRRLRADVSANTARNSTAA
jgi:hypothetical protein